MDKNHLKLMIKQLKMVVEELEADSVYSDPGKRITYADQEDNGLKRHYVNQHLNKTSCIPITRRKL